MHTHSSSIAIAALVMQSSPAWAFAPPLGCRLLQQSTWELSLHGSSVRQRRGLLEQSTREQSLHGSSVRQRRGLLDSSMCLSRPEPQYGGVAPATSGKVFDRVIRRIKTIPTHILHSQIPSECVDSGMAPAEPHQLVGKVKIDAVVWGLAAGVALVLAVACRTPGIAALLGVAEVMFFIFQALQARQMNAPPRPEPVRRDVGDLWRMCMRGSPDGPESFIMGKPQTLHPPP